MHVLVVNNYSPHRPLGRDRFATLEAVLKSLGARTTTVAALALDKVRTEDYNAVVLSGSDRMLSRPATISAFRPEILLAQTPHRPVLGICFGHQLLGVAYGARVARMNRSWHDWHSIDIVESDGLFVGVEPHPIVVESHREIVTTVPTEFLLLAQGPGYVVESMRHRKQPLFGVQFHPERYSGAHPAGRQVLLNFLQLAKQR